MHKKEDVKFGDEVVSWRYYRALYDIDKSSDIRAAPKLSHPHINPNPFQKMVVSYAAQIFSKTVADAICFYRDEMGNKFMENSKPTETFTRKINGLFDACNGRIPKHGIKPGTVGFQCISDFLHSLKPEDSFASELTMSSIRVTLNSILDAMKYLCEEVKYAYVLTGKLNQDPIEVRTTLLYFK